jgi:hypothetical protein
MYAVQVGKNRADTVATKMGSVATQTLEKVPVSRAQDPHRMVRAECASRQGRA